MHILLVDSAIEYNDNCPGLLQFDIHTHTRARARIPLHTHTQVHNNIMNKSHTYHLRNTTHPSNNIMIILNSDGKKKKPGKKTEPQFFHIIEDDETETHTHVNVYLYNVKTLQLSFARVGRGGGGRPVPCTLFKLTVYLILSGQLYTKTRLIIYCTFRL